MREAGSSLIEEPFAEDDGRRITHTTDEVDKRSLQIWYFSDARTTSR